MWAFVCRVFDFVLASLRWHLDILHDCVMRLTEKYINSFLLKRSAYTLHSSINSSSNSIKYVKLYNSKPSPKIKLKLLVVPNGTMDSHKYEQKVRRSTRPYSIDFPYNKTFSHKLLFTHNMCNVHIHTVTQFCIAGWGAQSVNWALTTSRRHCLLS